MAGIDDVALRAGVSTATVSRALSGRGYVADETRQRVQAAAAELGYVVSSAASGLASGHARTVALVVPSLNHWFFASVIEGASRRLARDGYDVMLYALSDGPEARGLVFSQFLLRGRIDAVITIGVELTAAERASLTTLGKPLVALGGDLPGVRTLAVDNVAVAELATNHLIALGHERIAHLGGTSAFDQDFHLPSLRHRGFTRAMAAAGLVVRDENVIRADFTLAGGHRAATQLLRPDGTGGGRPTAITAASDEMAFGALLAARDAGLRVPHDVSVIGVDDHAHAEFFSLTTIAQFPEEQGESAASAVLVELDRTATGGPRFGGAAATLRYELVVRGSTAPPALGAD